VAAAIGACSGSDSAGTSANAGAGIGAPVRSANCSDWQRAGPRERRASIAQIRDFAGGPTGQAPGRGNTLDDDRAYRLFQNSCEHAYARGFKLYKLYTRAAAFSDRR
jgi:hypothetical protein